MSAANLSRLLSRSDVVWFVGVGIVLALAAHKWDGANSVDVDFLALLPQTEHDPVVAAASARLVRATEDRMFWLVGGGSAEAASSSAATLLQMLEASGLFQRVDAAADESSVSKYARLFPYRFQLLDPTTLHSLGSNPESIVDTALNNTLGPFGVLRTQQLVPDPLGLFPRYLGTLVPSGIELFDGRTPMVHRGDAHYALLLTTAVRGAFDLDDTESLLDLVEHARAWAATQNVELLVTGVPLFAATNAQRAQFEVSTVGTGSMIGVILLFLVTFRSVRPLVLATFAISTGMLVAFTVSIWLFDRVHLLTFVFGATLIGVSDDYALHYLCDAFRSPNWNPRDATRRVLPGLALGLATTLTAYASLGIAPFPALRQIAVFCGAGLLGAWLTVVLLLPSHTRALAKHADPDARRTRICTALSDHRGPMGLHLRRIRRGGTGGAVLLGTTERRCSSLAGQDPAADAGSRQDRIAGRRSTRQPVPARGRSNQRRDAGCRAVGAGSTRSVGRKSQAACVFGDQQRVSVARRTAQELSTVEDDALRHWFDAAFLRRAARTSRGAVGSSRRVRRRNGSQLAAR